MTELKGYHAHVYYDANTKPIAVRLREALIGQFAVRPGAFSVEPIGPHPISQFSVIFQTEEFRKVDAEPRRSRRSRPPADRKLVRRPQQECAVARHAGADAARSAAAHLSHGAAADQLDAMARRDRSSRGSDKHRVATG